LTKHQNKQLVPTGEMLYILVAPILADKAVEVVSIQERNELSENEFIMEHIFRIISPTMNRPRPSTPKR
jgi:hypothetical protein